MLLRQWKHDMLLRQWKQDVLLRQWRQQQHGVQRSLRRSALYCVPQIEPHSQHGAQRCSRRCCSCFRGCNGELQLQVASASCYCELQ